MIGTWQGQRNWTPTNQQGSFEAAYLQLSEALFDQGIYTPSCVIRPKYLRYSISLPSTTTTPTTNTTTTHTNEDPPSFFPRCSPQKNHTAVMIIPHRLEKSLEASPSQRHPLPPFPLSPKTAVTRYRYKKIKRRHSFLPLAGKMPPPLSDILCGTHKQATYIQQP